MSQTFQQVKNALIVKNIKVKNIINLFGINSVLSPVSNNANPLVQTVNNKIFC